MSNYQQTTFFTPKDTLPTTSPLKTIFGAAYDVEFGNIATAIASKIDNGSTLSPTIASNLTITPSSGVGLTVNGVNGSSTIVAQAASGQTALIIAQTSNAGQATVSVSATSIATAVFTINNSGSTQSGIITGGAGIMTTTSTPLIIGTNSVARITIPITGGFSVTAPTTGSVLSLAVLAATGSSNGIVMSGGTNYIPWVNLGTAFYSTGTATATLSANKPGSNTSVSGWMLVALNGTQGYVPVWT